jgi:hypothetical protein
MQSGTRTAAELLRGGAGKQQDTIRFEIQRCRSGYYWRIVADRDDRVLASSESHPSKTRCNRDLATMLLAVNRAPVVDLS